MLKHAVLLRQSGTVARVQRNAVHLAVLHVLRRLHRDAQQRGSLLVALLLVLACGPLRHRPHSAALAVGQIQYVRRQCGQKGVHVDGAQELLRVEGVHVFGNANQYGQFL